MDHKKNLLYGVLAGVVLLILNNSFTLNTIQNLFDSTPMAFIIVRGIIYILSFVGILTVSFCSILLIVEVFKFRKKR